MLSAKAGAEHVYAIEANKHLTSLAEHIIGCNGLTDQITVVYVAAVISHACSHFRLVSFLPNSPVSPSLTRLFPMTHHYDSSHTRTRSHVSVPLLAVSFISRSLARAPPCIMLFNDLFYLFVDNNRNKLSTQVDVEVDIPKRANVLVSEILGTLLLGESVRGTDTPSDSSL